MPARRSFRLASLAPAVGLAALAACGTCTPPVPPTVDVPDALLPPPDEKLQRTLFASGVQIYECRVAAAGPAGATEWAFLGPEASLADEKGAVVGKHFAGPTWEAVDGTRIVGTVKAHVDSPRPGAIPWLLLETHNVGKGMGQFARVTSVQRVATEGGLPPETPCTGSTIGQQARVDYKAQYVLYAPSL